MKVPSNPVAALVFLLFPQAIAAPTASFLLSSIPPIVSTSWLEKMILDPQLLIIDTRQASAYSVSHLPGSINIPFAIDSL